MTVDDFVVIKLDTLSNEPAAGSRFMAARFGLAALLLAPFLGRSSSAAVVEELQARQPGVAGTAGEVTEFG